MILFLFLLLCAVKCVSEAIKWYVEYATLVLFYFILFWYNLCWLYILFGRFVKVDRFLILMGTFLAWIVFLSRKEPFSCQRGRFFYGWPHSQPCERLNFLFGQTFLRQPGMSSYFHLHIRVCPWLVHLLYPNLLPPPICNFIRLLSSVLNAKIQYSGFLGVVPVLYLFW